MSGGGVGPAGLSSALMVALAAGPWRSWLEVGLASHVLGLLLPLALLGALAALALGVRARDGGEAAPALIAGLALLALWMLPVTIDRSLRAPAVELAKLVSLPAAGFLLRFAWPALPWPLRALLEAQALSMALFLAWLYATTPQRLCASYRQDEQAVLAQGFLALAVGWAMLRASALLLGGASARHLAPEARDR